MTICDHCSSAVRYLRPHDFARRNNSENTIHVALPRYQKLSDINCWICYKFFLWLELENPKVLDIWCEESLPVTFHSYGRIQVVKLGSGPFLAPLAIEILPPDYTEGDDMGCEITLNFITVEDLTESQSIALNCGGIAASNFDLVRTWFNLCTGHHKMCKSFNNDWFPTRLIYIGSHDRDVKLIISEESPPNGPYMSLSHRWGSQVYTKLDSTTITQLQSAIDIGALPQVFQEAIKVARFLGINYMWIDALCIKQDKDDLSDWEVESLKMGKQQARAQFFPSRIELENEGLLETYYIYDGDIWKDEIDKGPLNQRGWVFQERFLAPRVLHFGRHQIGWECAELEALKMFPGGLSGVNILSGHTKQTRKTIEEAHAAELDQDSDIKFVDYWHDLVQAYSKTCLTYPKDKLIAFAGIAKFTGEIRTDRYFAGMWEKTLLYHLPWARYASGREEFPISETSSRAPSWSWASVDGEVTMPSFLGRVKAIFASGLEFLDPVDGTGSSFTGPSMIRAKCLCFLIDVALMDDEEEIMAFEVGEFHFVVNELGSETTMDVEVSPEELRLLMAQKKLFLMPLFATPYDFSAILLASAYGTDSYSRVGSLQLHLRVAVDVEKVPVVFEPQSNTSHASPVSGEGITDEVNWDMNAINFISYCVEQNSLARTINIS